MCQEKSSLHRGYSQHSHTDMSCVKASVQRKELSGTEDTIFSSVLRKELSSAEDTNFSSVHRNELSDAEDTVVLKDAELLNVSSHDVDVCLNSNLNVDIVGLSESARGLLMNGGSEMSHIENWSAVMGTYVSVLTSVFECSDVSMFRCILDKMMGSLVSLCRLQAPLDKNVFIIILSFW